MVTASERPITEPEINRVVIAHRLVQGGLILTLVWKWTYFRWAIGVYARIPLEDPFFPDWLRATSTMSIAYLGAIGASGLSFVTGSRFLHRCCAWLSLLCASILCIHQATYNDMTFVTAWWVAVWTLWYVHRDWNDRSANALLLTRAAFLSRVILSLILLGGAVGKWTSEYWSGEVLFDIYFRDRNYWLFNLLRAMFDQPTLREMATYYSRMIIVMETVGGLSLWLLPARWAAIAAMTIYTSIAVFSNWYLFSVVSCLIGLAAVGLLVSSEK